MKNRLSRESGLTLISLVIALAVFAFLGLLLLKIGPIYLEHYKVVSSLESLRNEPNLASKSKTSVRQLLMKRLDINMVTDVKKEHIDVKKIDGTLTVEIDYEVIKPIIGNVDVLVYFDDKVEVRAN